MADDTEMTKKPIDLWLKVLLFSSLAFNLLIVGIVAGALLRGGHDFQGRGESRSEIRDLGLGPFGLALSEQSRRDIGHAMGERRGELRQNRQQLRAQIDTLLAALRQQPYQPDTVRDILIVQQDQLFQRQTIGRVLLLSNLQAMDQGARAEYADRLERSLRRFQTRR